MTSWWIDLTQFEKIFWFISIVSSVFFFVQILASLVGAEFDFDADTEGGFSIRAVTAFLMFFGIIGAQVYGFTSVRVYALIGAVLAGLIAFTGVTLALGWMTRAEEKGNMNLENSLFQIGNVYIPIPGKLKGSGKIQIKIQSSIRELEALTKGEKLATGTVVKVVGIEGDKVIVEESDEKDPMRNNY